MTLWHFRHPGSNFAFSPHWGCISWLGDILSQGQIVPTAFLGRQIVPSDKMSHFLPRDKLSHQTNCPISSPETKCPTDALIKNHCSTGIFRETNCPIRQIVPLSPRRQNVPTYALMHKKVMESCWDILSPVKKAIGTICRKWKRPVVGIFRGVFFC